MVERKSVSVGSTQAECVPLVQASSVVPDDLILINVPAIVPNDDDDSSATPLTEPADEEFEPTIKDTRRLAKAAGVGSAVLGFVILGPLGAVVLGFGATYYAERDQGLAGDSARAMGGVALFVQQQFRQVRQRELERKQQAS